MPGESEPRKVALGGGGEDGCSWQSLGAAVLNSRFLAANREGRGGGRHQRLLVFRENSLPFALKLPEPVA